ncbi:MAG: HIT family protein [Cytophagales bacterium]
MLAIMPSHTISKKKILSIIIIIGMGILLLYGGSFNMAQTAVVGKKVLSETTIKYPRWVTFDRKQIEAIIDKTNIWYQNRQDKAGYYPKGVVFKIVQDKIVFIPSHAKSKEKRSFLAYGNLVACTQKTPCSFCKGAKNQIKLPKSPYTLIKSRGSGIPLIIDKEHPTGCWFEMDSTVQTKMLQAAQAVVKQLGKQNVDVSKTYIELHNGRDGRQTVGHTHLRIEGIAGSWFEKIKSA